jgi:3-oxoacyl-(acyl-carrier-protein) synthase
LKPRRIFVTGMGAVSAIGLSVSQMRDSLEKRESGIGAMTQLRSKLSERYPVGEVKLSNDELRTRLSLGAGEYSRTFLLALAAAREAVDASGGSALSDEELRRTGLVSATTVGGMDLTEEYFALTRRGGNDDIRKLLKHDCASHTRLLAHALGIGGFTSTVSTACSSSANAILYAALLIREGIVERAIAGGSDCLTRFTVNGFSSLKILNENLCAPFDEHRAGLNIGEGAAYLFLEPEEIAFTNKERIVCEVKGFGNACDAFHQTAMSEDGAGPVRSMRHALENASLSPNEIDYINAHGTGTRNNDLSEGRAIEHVFGTERTPRFSSTKSYTGHTLGAAGAIEAVISALTIQTGMVYPGFGRVTRMKELAIAPAKEVERRAKVDHVMSNSFGFGGNNTSLIFSRVELR